MLCCWWLFVGFSEHQWNVIIRLRHYEHRKLTTVLASLAVISIASKHLHNDLAKAIEALEQKKNRCCFLAQPYLNHSKKKTQLRTDMPRRQTKRTKTTEDKNDALTLLRLQQHVLKLTAAKAALEGVQTLVHETPLSNFTSAQDRRTLNTAQCCLKSLRIRVEAHVNSVEEAVKQRQLSLSQQLRKELSRTSANPEGMLARSNQYPCFQTSYDAHSAYLTQPGSKTPE